MPLLAGTEVLAVADQMAAEQDLEILRLLPHLRVTMEAQEEAQLVLAEEAAVHLQQDQTPEVDLLLLVVTAGQEQHLPSRARL
jgi:hypothetical protein